MIERFTRYFDYNQNVLLQQKVLILTVILSLFIINLYVIIAVSINSKLQFYRFLKYIVKVQQHFCITTISKIHNENKNK